ncbi:MAG: hypothetical protein IJT83_08955 [Victivallales bacterium]|nr:hypothetical protein [Victivallales bacterium]
MRILHNPRVYIYSIAAILACVFFTWHEKIVARHNAAKRGYELHDVDIQRQAPVAKDAEMSPASNLPKLYLFGDETSVPFANSLRQRLAGKCTLMHIISSDEKMRAFFKIKSLPAAILFNEDNDELSRFEPPYSEEKLADQVLNSLPQK